MAPRFVTVLGIVLGTLVTGLTAALMQRTPDGASDALWAYGFQALLLACVLLALLGGRACGASPPRG